MWGQTPNWHIKISVSLQWWKQCLLAKVKVLNFNYYRLTLWQNVCMFTHTCTQTLIERWRWPLAINRHTVHPTRSILFWDFLCLIKLVIWSHVGKCLYSDQESPKHSSWTCNLYHAACEHLTDIYVGLPDGMKHCVWVAQSLWHFVWRMQWD